MFRNVILDYREPTHTPTLVHKSGIIMYYCTPLKKKKKNAMNYMFLK